MKSRSFEELIAGDQRSRRFAPTGGFDTARVYHPQVTAELMQRSIQRVQLVSGVADVVRDRFEIAQLLHVYGTFAYEFFGVAVTEAHLLYETALGARFVETYAGQIPLVRRRTGESVVLEIPRFSELTEALRRGRYRYWARSKKHDGWLVRGLPEFDCSLPALLRWAHDAGLLATWLDGRWEDAYPPMRIMAQTSDQHVLPKGYRDWDEDQRDAWWQVERRSAWDRENLEHVARFRNHLAHPHGSGLTMPSDSRSSIAEVADFVNSLWTVTPVQVSLASEEIPVRAWLDRILSDVRQVLVQRFIWQSVRAVIAANPSIHEDDAFYRWMNEVYATAAAAAVRRQTDRGADAISLVRLLEVLGVQRDLVSREHHVRLFAEMAPAPADARPNEVELWRHEGNAAYDHLVGVGQTYYDPTDDIARLLQVAAPIKEYVNEHIAHAAEEPHEPATTYAHLDRALDVLDELVRKAYVLITGDALVNVVPVFQFDWMTVFDKPWRSR